MHFYHTRKKDKTVKTPEAISYAKLLPFSSNFLFFFYDYNASKLHFRLLFIFINFLYSYSYDRENDCCKKNLSAYFSLAILSNCCKIIITASSIEIIFTFERFYDGCQIHYLKDAFFSGKKTGIINSKSSIISLESK